MQCGAPTGKSTARLALTRSIHTANVNTLNSAGWWVPRRRSDWVERIRALILTALWLDCVPMNWCAPWVRLRLELWFANHTMASGRPAACRDLSGLARNFGDVFELWSGGQCGVGVVVSGDALE